MYCLLVAWGCVLTYSQFLCAAVCSALTASLVGVAKSVGLTLLGFFTFGGVKFHPLNVAGLSMNMFGGILYTAAKFNQPRSKGEATLPSYVSREGSTSHLAKSYSNNNVFNKRDDDESNSTNSSYVVNVDDPGPVHANVNTKNNKSFNAAKNVL